jgi:acetyl-CoA carboxylase carboxyltransferase component
MEERLAAIRADEMKIAQGGGAKAVERQHEKGRLTARARIALLLDPGSDLFELHAFAAHGMYEEWGTPAAAGVVIGVATIASRRFLVIANDATVKAGAFFPMTCKKVLRAQNIALQNHLPVIYLVDSAGVFLPLQDEVFPDEDDFGRVFRNNAVLSAQGTPQIAAIMGMCVAGGAYLPVMCDTLLMTTGSGLFLAGPSLVKAAIGQVVDAEELGGASMHAEISGTVDFKEPSDESCLARIRSIVERMGARPTAPFDRAASRPPLFDPAHLSGIVSPDGAAQYDVRDVLARIVDGSEFEEYRAEYGPTVVCGFARLGGFAVGIVANQKTHQKRAGHPIEFGGVIYRECAEKAARFMLDCGQNRIPLVFLHDVNGLVGKESEQKDHPRRRQDGTPSATSRPEDQRHPRRLLRRRPLRHVRQGVRPALPLRLAERALRRHGRRAGGRHARRPARAAAREAGEEAHEGGDRRAPEGHRGALRDGPRSAVCGGAALGRQDPRAFEDARGADPRARGRGAESRRAAAADGRLPVVRT